MIKKLLPLMLFSSIASANPNLVADPQCYDNTALCPDGYEFSMDGGNTWNTLNALVDANTIQIYHDLQPYNPGSYNWLVRGKNIWGVSDSVPFDFAAGVPAGPTGLRIIAE